MRVYLYAVEKREGERNGRKKSKRRTSDRDEESQSVCGASAYLDKTGVPQIRPRINELERGIVVGGNDDGGGGQDKEQRKRNGRREQEKKRETERGR